VSPPVISEFTTSTPVFPVITKAILTPITCYSKTANIMFTTALAAKLSSKGVLAFAVHPGVIRTNLATHIEYNEFSSLSKILQGKVSVVVLGVSVVT
jgi:NAD(P)-dependent dehydrogenase (short-subunit alcohol dehydrogenase family)